jgi:phage terminase large subunit-like protein
MSKSRHPEPEFNQVNEGAQRAVAERLLKIEESGWKPFWCADPECDGMPHWLLDDDGDCSFVEETAPHGPNKEPVGERVYEDESGEWIQIEEGEAPDAGWTLLGRPVYDPKWAHNHARKDQRLPPWLKPWTLFIMSGRGAGKTRTGVEFVTLCARKGLDGAILGRRGTELVNTHVAEIIAHAHPEFVPTHWASKDILEWPNGAITYLFSAEKPENIRSVNLSYAWVDEAAFMDEIETAWMNLTLATRVKKPGNPIHFLITSTPTGSKWVCDMEDDEDVITRRVSTYANRANLDPGYLAKMRKKYEGTRMGRQELHGEVLRDVEGAFWNDDMFDNVRAETAEAFESWLDSMDDRVLAVDPAGSKGKHSDATGIIGVGAQHTDVSRFTVLLDATIKGSPAEWAEQTFKAARMMKARRIVVEKNFGGEMVRQVLRDWAKLNPEESVNDEREEFKIDVVHAVKSKETRAEGTVGKYEQGRVKHLSSPGIFGDMSALEKEQVLWVPKSRGGRFPSPNRIDALVWAVRALEDKVKFTSQTATFKGISKKVKNVARATPAAVSRNASPTVTEAQPKPYHRPEAIKKRRRFPVKKPVE